MGHLHCHHTHTTTRLREHSRRGGEKNVRARGREEGGGMLPSGQDVALTVMNSQQLLLPVQDRSVQPARVIAWMAWWSLAHPTPHWAAMAVDTCWGREDHSLWRMWPWQDSYSPINGPIPMPMCIWVALGMLWGVGVDIIFHCTYVWNSQI